MTYGVDTIINLDKYKFTIVHYGETQCEPNHNFGPGVKTSYMIVFVLNGKGKFTMNNVTTTLSTGNVFLVEPNVIHQYTADSRNPWRYAWISFDCDAFDEDFTTIKTNNGVRHIPSTNMISKYISRIARNEKYEPTGYKSIRDDALFKLFLSEFLAEDFEIYQPKKVTNIQKVKDYIDHNYFLPLSVEEIASKFNYNRSYLCRLFKEVEGKSPKEYIIDSKMKIASKLLLESDITVENVSNSVGYRDSFNFSKMFKKKMGLAPQDYKKYVETTLKQYF